MVVIMTNYSSCILATIVDFKQKSWDFNNNIHSQSSF